MQAELSARIDQQLTFDPDVSMICPEFPVQNDTIALEPVETLTFDLTLITVTPGASIGDPDVMEVMIKDDDGELRNSNV